jgi:hypothetical protein
MIADVLTKAPSGMPPPNAFASTRISGTTLQCAREEPPRATEAGNHFIKNQQRPDFITLSPQPRQKAAIGNAHAAFTLRSVQ